MTRNRCLAKRLFSHALLLSPSLILPLQRQPIPPCHLAFLLGLQLSLYSPGHIEIHVNSYWYTNQFSPLQAAGIVAPLAEKLDTHLPIVVGFSSTPFFPAAFTTVDFQIFASPFTCIPITSHEITSIGFWDKQSLIGLCDASIHMAKPTSHGPCKHCHTLGAFGAIACQTRMKHTRARRLTSSEAHSAYCCSFQSCKLFLLTLSFLQHLLQFLLWFSAPLCTTICRRHKDASGAPNVLQSQVHKMLLCKGQFPVLGHITDVCRQQKTLNFFLVKLAEVG